MSSGKALLGILAGVAAGALMGMIFAQRKGSQRKHNISKKGEDLANALNEKIDRKFEELMLTATGRIKKGSGFGESEAFPKMVE